MSTKRMTSLRPHRTPSRSVRAAARCPKLSRAWLLGLALLASGAPLGAEDPPEDPGLPLPVGVPLRPEPGRTRVLPGDYLRQPSAEDGAVVLLEGLRDVELDLTGVELRGGAREDAADSYTGIGILLRDCAGIRIVGGELGGFRTCISIETSEDVTIEGTRFERYHGSRLYSTHTAVDSSDRLDLNASAESWLANHGAALGVRDSARIRVLDCRARAGQNGIVMLRTQQAELVGNDFSFLSGWGAALVECGDALLAHGRFEGCVRGYSHDVFSADFGASGVLLRACEGTRLVDSSLSHSGVGVRLLGGTNNLVARCGLSQATCGGLLALNESNLRVYANELRGALGYGLALRACDSSQMVGNSVESVSGPALRLQGSADALVLRNVLKDSEVGLELRPTDVEPTRSVWVEANSFAGNDNDLLFEDAVASRLRDNVFPTEFRELSARGVTDLEGQPLELADVTSLFAGMGGWLPSGALHGGSVHPAEFESAPEDRDDALANRVSTPPGTLPQRSAGSYALDSIVLGSFFPWDFASAAERPPARAGGILANSRWDARWFSWREGPDPRGSEIKQQAWRALADEPDLRREVGPWRSPFGDGQVDEEVREAVGSSQFGLIATTELELENGHYRLSVVSDDGVRLRVDGGTILQDWTWHPAKRRSIDLRLTGGSHELTVEYFQIDGAAALSVDLVRLPDDPRTAKAR